MKNLWQDSGMTIVLLPSGKQGDDLLEIASLWTDLRMLSNSIWIRPELLLDDAQRPPRQEALVLGASKSGETLKIKVDLFEQLARQSLLNVRLLVVRSALPNHDFDEAQNSLVDLVSQYMSLSMPLPVAGADANDLQTNLLKLNLITNPTEYVSDFGSNLLDQRFNANFVAAAEDRSAPLAGDAFVRYETGSLKFAGFTMLHVATLGALWSGLPQGAYELINPGVWAGDKVYVSRVFLSSILTDGLARRVSSRVLRRAANPSDGFTDLSSEIPIDGTFPIADSDIDAFISFMVEQTFGFDNQILTYVPTMRAALPEANIITILKQFREFVVFSVDKILRVPYFAWIQTLRLIVRLLNTIFQRGDKGASRIREPEEKLDQKDLALQQERQRVLETKGKADAALISPVSPSHLRSTPELWGNIRKLVFGMLDGSNLADFGIKRADNGWPVFHKVAKVFHDPSDTIEIRESYDTTNSLELNWTEVTHAEDRVKDFFQSSLATRISLDKKLAELLKFRAEIQALEEERASLQDQLQGEVVEETSTATRVMQVSDLAIEKAPTAAVAISDEDIASLTINDAIQSLNPSEVSK